MSLPIVPAFHFIMAAADLAAGVWVRFGGRAATAGALVIHSALATGLAILLPAQFYGGQYGPERLMFLHLGVHLPICLVLIAVGRGQRRGWSIQQKAAVGLGLGLASLAGWARWVEPRWLEVRHVDVPTNGPPLRIVLVADLQTDTIGSFQRRVLSEAVRAAPDVVLFAGDYLQLDGDLPNRPDSNGSLRPRPPLSGPGKSLYFENLGAELHHFVATAAGASRLGGYAVRGDVENDGWTDLFDGTDIVASDSTTIHVVAADPSGSHRGPAFEIVALSLEDSRRTDLVLPPPSARFRIVLGHAPEFALSSFLDAELLLSGHTHGGQVRLPGYGALTVRSRVPLSWGAGLTSLGRGSFLYVSRGLGVQQQMAPKIRFFCRPELTVLHVGAEREWGSASYRGAQARLGWEGALSIEDLSSYRGSSSLDRLRYDRSPQP